MNKKAFTLVELLVVVLIIGILSAVALPMYQGAVDKSRFSTLLPAAKSIKDAEEAMRMSTGLYTDKMEDLDISMENGELNFTFDIHNSLADPSLFRVTNPKLDNVRLAAYFDYNPMMAGQMHCEAKAGDERANRLCGPLLQGQELGTTTDGYNRYVLEGNIDKATCDGVNFVWSKKNTKCFKTEEDRCKANGAPYENGFCGYQASNRGEYTGITIEEGATCTTLYDALNSCQNVTVNDGGVCDGSVDWSCNSGTVNSGGKCISRDRRSCNNMVLKDGARCVNDGGFGCASATYEGSACCEGENCGSAPKCQD